MVRRWGSRLPAHPVPETTADGLPKRRRRGAISIVPTENESTETPARDSARAASVMGAFQRGTQSGRRSTDASNEGHEVQ